MATYHIIAIIDDDGNLTQDILDSKSPEMLQFLNDMIGKHELLLARDYKCPVQFAIARYETDAINPFVTQGNYERCEIATQAVKSLDVNVYQDKVAVAKFKVGKSGFYRIHAFWRLDNADPEYYKIRTFGIHLYKNSGLYSELDTKPMYVYLTGPTPLEWYHPFMTLNGLDDIYLEGDKDEIEIRMHVSADQNLNDGIGGTVDLSGYLNIEYLGEKGEIIV